MSCSVFGDTSSLRGKRRGLSLLRWLPQDSDSEKHSWDQGGPHDFRWCPRMTSGSLSVCNTAAGYLKFSLSSLLPGERWRHQGKQGDSGPPRWGLQRQRIPWVPWEAERLPACRSNPTSPGHWAVCWRNHTFVWPCPIKCFPGTMERWLMSSSF